MPKLGCHISSAGGLEKIFARAKIAEAECLQTFAGSPQTWKPAEYSDEQVKIFKETREKNKDIGPLFIHSMYLINLASENNNIRYGSIGSLVKTLTIADQLGFDGIITHTGSAGTRTFEEALPTVQKSLLKILEGVPPDLTTKLYLENAAGAGSIIGDTMHELGELLRVINHDPRVGVCLDTCHAFVSGYDLRSNEEIDRLDQEIKTEFGWEFVAAIHVNDSKGNLGSHLDRHEVIGQGFLGIETFKKLLNHPQFSSRPWILETPDLKADLKESPESLRTLKSLR